MPIHPGAQQILGRRLPRSIDPSPTLRTPGNMHEWRIAATTTRADRVAVMVFASFLSGPRLGFVV